jgi:hypothetical protein
MASGTAHFEGFFNSGYLQATILSIPVLEVIGNPSGSCLVPLEGENVMMISDLDLVALFPAPSSISPHHIVRNLFGGVFCIH